MLTKTEKAHFLRTFFPFMDAARLVLGKTSKIECDGFSASQYAEDGEISVFKDGYLVAVIY